MVEQLEDLFEYLETVDPNAVVDTAAAWLANCRSAQTIVANYLEELPTRVYIEQASASYHWAEAPTTIQIRNSESGKFSAYLNYFDRDIYDQRLAQRWLAPHTHAFDFVSKVLRGGYAHLVYDTDEGPENVILRLRKVHHVRAGDICTMDHQMPHFVAAPIQDTITLMLRSRKYYEANGLQNARVGRKKLLDLRTRLIGLLQGSAT